MASLLASKHNEMLSASRQTGQAQRLFSAVFTILMAMLLTACTPLGLVNAWTPDSNARVSRDVAYGTVPRQKLDIYAPPQESGRPAPVVVFFYGGNWNSGSRSDYAFVGHALASRGITTVVADYRLYPEVRYPRFVEDAALAVTWTARNIERFGGDPNRLFVMGHSAGAYNAAMVALDKRWLDTENGSPPVIKAWIGLAGPYDFLPIANPDIKPVFYHPDRPLNSQPIRHAGPGSPPALLIAAKSDTVVNPVRNTASLAERLRQNQVPVVELYYDRVNHATLIATLSPTLRYLAPTLDAVDRFVHSNGRGIDQASSPD
jgi:acetyl esterase/lipase